MMQTGRKAELEPIDAKQEYGRRHTQGGNLERWEAGIVAGAFAEFENRGLERLVTGLLKRMTVMPDPEAYDPRHERSGRRCSLEMIALLVARTATRSLLRQIALRCEAEWIVFKKGRPRIECDARSAASAGHYAWIAS